VPKATTATTKVRPHSPTPLSPTTNRTSLKATQDPPSDHDFDVEDALAEAERNAQDNDEEGNANNFAGNDTDADVDANTTTTARPATRPDYHSALNFTSNPTHGAPTSKEPPTYASFSTKREEPLKYICGNASMEWDRGADGMGRMVWRELCKGFVEIRLGEPMRCKSCGCRMLLKCRTERMVQFDAR
jgi:DNA-directed RNA polymerase subunit RPC12/RpoP